MSCHVCVLVSNCKQIIYYTFPDIIKFIILAKYFLTVRAPIFHLKSNHASPASKKKLKIQWCNVMQLLITTLTLKN